MKRKLSLIMAVVMTLTMVFGYVGRINTNAEKVQWGFNDTKNIGGLSFYLGSNNTLDIKNPTNTKKTVKIIVNYTTIHYNDMGRESTTNRDYNTEVIMLPGERKSQEIDLFVPYGDSIKSSEWDITVSDYADSSSGSTDDVDALKKEIY